MRRGDLAYAIRVTEENIKGIILSEAGENYDVIEALKWLAENEEGWFLRDEGSGLDCQFFVSYVFDVMYEFAGGDESSLIRVVRHK